MNTINSGLSSIINTANSKNTEDYTIGKIRKRRLTNEQINSFRKTLKSASCKKDVENAYKKLFSDAFSYAEDNFMGLSSEWISPYHCDGLFTNEALMIRMLLEAKFNKSSPDNTTKCEALLQAIYYLKMFKENDPDNMPNIVFIGDVNECFIVAASDLDKYLSEKLNRTLSSSSAAFDASNQGIILKLLNDEGISPYAFQVNDKKINLNDVFQTIEIIARIGKIDRIQVTERNLRIVYDKFLRCVIDDNGNVLINSNKKPESELSIEIVNIFIASLLYKDEIRFNSKERNRIEIPIATGEANVFLYKKYIINEAEYRAFFARFSRSFTPEEKKVILSISDQLIEDTKRRYMGDFWTPSIWSHEGDKCIAELVDREWNKNFVVWDCCCGTKNLTRDLCFNRLYCSSIHSEELNISQNYNKEAVATFQYDFLNDDLNINKGTGDNESKKMPNDLFLDLKNDKPFLFKINPPYATANNMGANSSHKEGVAKTGVNQQMINNNMGRASQQLLCQFLYRIAKIKDDFNLSRVVIACYINPIFLSPSTYFSGFRKYLFSKFQFKGGFIFPAGDFNGVSSNWGVTFCIFDSKLDSDYCYDETKENKWVFSVKEYDKKSANIIYKNIKTFRYWPKQYSCSEWIRQGIKKLNPTTELYPFLASALEISQASVKSGRLLDGYIGYMVSNANNVYQSLQNTWIQSTGVAYGHGVCVCPQNFEACIVTFVSRAVCSKKLRSYLYNKSEFHTPVVDDVERYNIFLTDCTVYLFFAVGGNQSSIEISDSDNNSFDVRNGFFPYRTDKIKKLANKKEEDGGSSFVYDDIEEFIKTKNKEPFVATFIEKNVTYLNKSPEGLEVFKLGFSLIEQTMGQRNNTSKPYCVNRWDAGYKQLQSLLIEPELTNNIKEAQKVLEEKLYKEVLHFKIIELN